MVPSADGNRHTHSILARSADAAEAARHGASIWGLAPVEEMRIEPGTRLFSILMVSDTAVRRQLCDFEEVQELLDDVVSVKGDHREAWDEFLANGGERFEANSRARGYDIEVELDEIA